MRILSASIRKYGDVFGQIESRKLLTPFGSGVRAYAKTRTPNPSDSLTKRDAKDSINYSINIIFSPEKGTLSEYESF